MKKDSLANAADCPSARLAEQRFDVRDYHYAMGEKYLRIWGPEEQTKIDRDIEKNRKADGVFALDVPAGTIVKIEQTRHAFFFGAHIFNFDQLPTEEANRQYKALWKELLNSATLPFYWKYYEPEPGVFNDDPAPDNTPRFWQSCKEPWKGRFFRHPAIKPLLDFCDANHVRKHGHPIVWGANFIQPSYLFDAIPKELTGSESFQKSFACKDPANETLGWCSYHFVTGHLTETEIAEKYPDFCRFINETFEKRIIGLCEKYGDRIDSWDVVNESVHETAPWDEFGTTPRMVPGGKITKSIYGVMPGDYVYASFKTAAAHLPRRAQLNINDNTMVEAYADQINALLSRGAKIDAVGWQTHVMDVARTLAIAEGQEDQLTPSNVRHVFETIGKTGLPTRLSEITLLAPTSDAKGEAMQAVLAYNLYRLWFSFPSMTGITWWNTIDFSSPTEYFASGILRPDMSKKPVYFALDDLINRQWKTNLTVRTDEKGEISFRGFRGTYKLSWVDSQGKKQEKMVELK